MKLFGKESKSWEDKCHRCGLCCHEKVIVGDSVVYDLDSYCPHYDPKTHQCTIYLQRLEIEQRCRRVTRFKAMFASYLPETCAYVQEARRLHLRFAPKRTIHFARSSLSSDDDAPSFSPQV
jgi:uncharacterized cysteine cluster protein YcgN (CxxCxxCC family)